MAMSFENYQGTGEDEARKNGGCDIASTEDSIILWFPQSG